MKIHADYRKVLALKQQVDNHDYTRFTPEETAILRQILAAAEGDIFPSQEELERQEMNVKLLERLDPDSDAWKRIMAECTEFENKYC